MTTGAWGCSCLLIRNEPSYNPLNKLRKGFHVYFITRRLTEACTSFSMWSPLMITHETPAPIIQPSDQSGVPVTLMEMRKINQRWSFWRDQQLFILLVSASRLNQSEKKQARCPRQSAATTAVHACVCNEQWLL